MIKQGLVLEYSVVPSDLSQCDILDFPNGKYLSVIVPFDQCVNRNHKRGSFESYFV